MNREDALMEIIKTKYKSLRNFSIHSGIPNSTLNSMFKKGLGGTAVDTVLKVCDLLGCDIYSLTDNKSEATALDRSFFSDYLKLDESSKELVRLVAEHQLANGSAEHKSNEIEFPTEKTLNVNTIKVYLNSASAGFGEYIEDSDFTEIEFNSSIPSNADFGVSIHGDSMTPKISDGDVVWVEETEDVQNEQIGVFILNGDALCKKLIRYGDEMYLRSLNPKYNDIPITEFDDLKVVGKVLGSSDFPQ